MKSHVSRAVFQRVAEENKRLKRQLRILCLDPGVEAIKLRMELRDKFKKEDGMKRALNKVIASVARDFFKEHPELRLENIKKKNENKKVQP